MKRILALMLLFPIFANAHSQVPREIKKFVATERVSVPGQDHENPLWNKGWREVTFH